MFKANERDGFGFREVPCFRRQSMTKKPYDIVIISGDPGGGTTFTPIINYPEVAILGLGRARLQPVVCGTMEHPQMDPRFILPNSFAFDHRVNDGADAARFVHTSSPPLQTPKHLHWPFK
ncbi:MAG: hypothetical protein NPIRA01_01750 [Nitrospirales bacterium]|nr:MAG: hypothetical protein NPIRA01_01750 [Nitrospirales bacterium]